MATSSDFIIPCTLEEWSDMASIFGVPNASVNSTEPMQSGSSVTVQQFLSFRILWSGTMERHRNAKLNKKDPKVQEAMDFLDGFNEFKAYIAHVTDGSRYIPPIGDGVHSLGPFQQVLKYQQQVNNVIEPPSIPDRVRLAPNVRERDEVADRFGCRTRQRSLSVQYRHVLDGLPVHLNPSLPPLFRDTPTRETPAGDQEHNWEPTKDEQIVNQALMGLLDGITMNMRPAVSCGWIIGRLRFNVKFAAATMEARTDGYLYGPYGGDEAFVIVEVKAAKRRRRNVQGRAVYMQESAEMLAWIRHDQRVPRKFPLPTRLLVSQDRHEIWLTTALYDDNYLAYLENKSQGDPGFMTMKEAGPFNIFVARDMEKFATHVVLFCREISEGIEQSLLGN